MVGNMIITSLDNPKIKYLSSLNKAKERKQEQKFIVEGKHLVDEAKKQNVLIEAYSIEEKEGYIQVAPSVMKKITNTNTLVSEIGLCKMLFFILAIACMATVGMNAQRYNRASFGIIGGLTSSKSHVKDVDASSLSLYHVGITAQLPLFSGLAIQPSLLYQVKGTSVDNIDDAQWKDFQTKVGYLELPVQIQWGPDLGITLA